MQQAHFNCHGKAESGKYIYIARNVSSLEIKVLWEHISLSKRIDRDLCDLAEVTEQSWTPGTSSIVDVETCCSLTYLHDFICFSCSATSFAPVCGASSDKRYTIFLWKPCEEQLSISLESGIFSFPIGHSFGLWQSVHRVWFLSYRGNKLPIFMACFSWAALQQSHIVRDRLRLLGAAGKLARYSLPL